MRYPHRTNDSETHNNSVCVCVCMTLTGPKAHASSSIAITSANVVNMSTCQLSSIVIPRPSYRVTVTPLERLKYYISISSVICCLSPHLASATASNSIAEMNVKRSSRAGDKKTYYLWSRNDSTGPGTVILLMIPGYSKVDVRL
jgi:hypothetical protein